MPKTSLDNSFYSHEPPLNKGPKNNFDLAAANKDYYESNLEALPHPQAISKNIHEKLSLEGIEEPKFSSEIPENMAKPAANDEKEHPLEKKIPELMQYVSTLGTGSSVLANLFNLSPGFRKFCDNAAEFSSKAFIFANSVVRSLSQLKRKNFLAASGYLWDIVVSLFVPMRVAFLARGPSSGLTQFGHSLTMMTKKEKFNSTKEHIDHIKEGVSKGIQMIKNFNLKDIITNKDSPFLAFIGGILGTSGTIIWALTGNERLGTKIRDLGGAMLDGEQVLPKHKGRFFYNMSGWSFLVGTLADYYTKHGSDSSPLAKKIPYIKKAAESFTFFADNIGKFLLGRSEATNELPT